MGSVFEQLFSARAKVFYDAHGSPAVYTAPDGTVTSGLTVQLERDDVMPVPREVKASGELQTGRASVPQSQLAKPAKDGRFQFNGSTEVWTITASPVAVNGQHYCTVSRSGVERLMPRRSKD